MIHSTSFLFEASPLGTAKRLIPLLDLTSLRGDESESDINSLCERAITVVGPVAAICVYPRWVKQVRSDLASLKLTKPSNVEHPKIATVSNFPGGDNNIPEVSHEIETALSDGADEIDVVFPWRAWLTGDTERATAVIEAARAATPSDKTLKVIIESGELSAADAIESVTKLVIANGADFVKTSTGKASVGATIEAATVILNTIKRVNPRVGFKAAGGIRTIPDADQYLNLARSIMGEEWPTPQHFRIGASTLLDELTAGLG